MHAPFCAAIEHSPHDEFIAYYVLPLMSQIMCSPFWPNESVHSIEYGQLAVTFVNTTPKPDWEMTVLQVADKNRVSSAEVLYSMYASIFIPLATSEMTKWFSPQSSGPSLEVTLFHFLSWLREGRPPIDSMLKMMGEVENKQKDVKAPLMVMCE